MAYAPHKTYRVQHAQGAGAGPVRCSTVMVLDLQNQGMGGLMSARSGGSVQQVQSP